MLRRALGECEETSRRIHREIRALAAAEAATGGAAAAGGAGAGAGAADDAEGAAAAEGCLSMSTLGGGLVAQPAGMGGGGRRLKEYQLVGLNWLRLMWRMELGCILADEMGLGKTIQLIALLAALRAGGEARPHLVVAPASVLDNWLRELRAWCPSLRAAKYHGPQAERYALQERLDDDGFDVLLTTYSYFEGDSAAQRDDRAWLGRKEWGAASSTRRTP